MVMEDINIKEVPDKFYYLNENGTFSDVIKENKPLENSRYWKEKTTQIGLLMFFSMGILILFLIVETDIFNFFWRMLWGV